MICDLCGHLTSDHDADCPNRPPVMTCPYCGEGLFYGNVWYPDLECCSECVSDKLTTYEEVIRKD